MSPPGDPTAHQTLHRLYSDHHSWLYAELRRKLGSAFDAADLAQDTFLRVLSTPPAVEIREPRAFLRTVARGLLVNFLRRRALERAYVEVLLSQPEATYPGPEEQALVVEALVAIDTLLSGLPANVREAFLLSQLQGLRYADIAQRLGVSLSMVKKYMLRALTHCMHLREV